MEKMKLAIIFGGQSSEYKVSLHSAASFLRSIHTDRYDLALIGIDPHGHFYYYTGDIDHIEHDTWNNPQWCTPLAWKHKGIVLLSEENREIQLDCAFPILHGKNGEDGCIQGLLELMNIPYAGCDVLGSAMCMDKDIMHILCLEAGIPAADFVTLHENRENPSFEEIARKIPLPWIIKPCNAGSSYGVSKVETEEDFAPALKEAFYYDGRNKALVEKAIDGFEIGCAVMGNEALTTGKLDEIEIHGGFFDYEGKYEMKDAAIHCPARISKEIEEKARQLAEKSYRALNCQGMARVDMFVTREGDVLLNEINTIPGFTETSRYPTMMKEAGLNFPDLIDQLVALAAARKIAVC